MSGTSKSWKDEIQDRMKWFDEEIKEFEQLRGKNLENAWVIIFTPLLNLFTIGKDYLTMLDKLREKTLTLEDRIKRLEEKDKS